MSINFNELNLVSKFLFNFFCSKVVNLWHLCSKITTICFFFYKIMCLKKVPLYLEIVGLAIKTFRVYLVKYSRKSIFLFNILVWWIKIQNFNYIG